MILYALSCISVAHVVSRSAQALQHNVGNIFAKGGLHGPALLGNGQLQMQINCPHTRHKCIPCETWEALRRQMSGLTGNGTACMSQTCCTDSMEESSLFIVMQRLPMTPHTAVQHDCAHHASSANDRFSCMLQCTPPSIFHLCET